jgi:transcriptional regulator with XRE-family HTH domain
MESLDKKRLADVVKSGRATKGYTQQELADLTRISLRSIQRIENGEVEPRVYTLRLLEEHLGVSITAVAAIVPPTTTTTVVVTGTTTPATTATPAPVNVTTTDNVAATASATTDNIAGTATPTATNVATATAAVPPATTTAVVVTGKKTRTRKTPAQKWILTVSIGLLILLLTIAFLAQSAHFPETDFERLLLYSGVLAVYTLILLKIWR